MMPLREPFASLEGRTAVVTGSARGIGYEIAWALRLVGMSLLLIDKDGDELGRAVEAIRRSEAPGDVAAVTADLGADDLAGVETALDGLAPVAVWVNNAGGVSHQAAEVTDPATFEALFRNNVVSALRGGQLAYRRMTAASETGGAIVNITSLVTEKVMPERLSYSTSKAALGNVTRHMAQEWGPRGIRVNAVSPGYIDSRLTQWAADDPRQISKLATVGTLALRRLGQASDIAQTVLYLVSPLASYVTGQTIFVDGGWHLI
jgi:NAD(P)-dependent dehydrogenase (short-subunit alcohol dehydrogenase family)